MRKFVIRDAYVEVDGNDISCAVQSVEVNLEKNQVEANSMCGQDVLPGLEQSNFVVNIYSSFENEDDSGGGQTPETLHEILHGLYESEERFPIAVRPHQDDVSDENPEFRGTSVLLTYSPLSGAVGDVAQTSVTFPIIGNSNVSTEPES